MESLQETSRQNIKCDFYLNLLTMIIILFSEPPACKMPLQFWLFVYFMIQMGQIGYHLMVEKIDDSTYFQQRRKLKMYIKKLSIVALESFHMGWILYGNVLYFSATNTCMNDNVFLTWLMFFILVIGYFKLLFYFVLLGAIIFYCVQKRFEKSKQ
mmetsp:Transcript_37317/g.35912  ORF Transcript_37317/g.35912 Transcript_37317/m.35912 type:complete len:155 (+) Transcript_37317:283-747(+)